MGQTNCEWKLMPHQIQLNMIKQTVNIQKSPIPGTKINNKHKKS